MSTSLKQVNKPKKNVRRNDNRNEQKFVERLIKISDKFTVAAAFGNVHGVYKPGNVKLTPKILKNSQEYISKKFKEN